MEKKFTTIVINCLHLDNTTVYLRTKAVEDSDQDIAAFIPVVISTF